jgi:hypothetical protein
MQKRRDSVSRRELIRETRKDEGSSLAWDDLPLRGPRAPRSVPDMQVLASV